MAISMNLVRFPPFLEPRLVSGIPSDEIPPTVLMRDVVALSVCIFVHKARTTRSAHWGT